MPAVRVVHFNPADTKGKTKCGRVLAKVRWTTSPEDVTCNSCAKGVKAGT